MRRTIGLIVILALVLSMGLVGCKQETQEPSPTEGKQAAQPQETEAPAEEVELRLMALGNESQVALFKTVFEQYSAKTENVEVKLDHVPGGWDEFNQKLITQIAAGSPPDIADISVIYRDSFIKEGYLVDVMPNAIETGFDFSKYYDAQFTGIKKGEALYGVPSGSSLMGLYYNKDMFAAAGIDPPTSVWEDAWTWDEFLAVAQQLTQGEGPEKTYGFATTVDIGWFFPTFYQNNADFLAPDGTKSSMNEPEAVETLEYINELISTSSPSLSSLATIDAATMFKTGKVAMYMDGNWWMDDFHNNIDGFEWGVAALPQKEIVQTGVYVDDWCVINGSKNVDEAWNLLEYLMEEEQQVMGICKGIPPMKTVAETMYAELYSYLDDTERSVWMDGNSVGRTPTYTDDWAEIIGETNKRMEKMFIGESTPKDTAAEIETVVNEILNK